MKPISAKRPKAVLFDLDGTLVDTAPDFYAVVNGLRQELGLSLLPDARIREQVSNGGAALTQLTWEIAADHPELGARRLVLLERYSQHLGSKSQLFTGFEETLTWFEQQNIQWGIVTNKPREYSVPLLERLNLHTATLVCPNDVARAKPHPDPLFKAAAELNVKAEECWYVGDHIRDIDAARAANMLSVAALFGYIEPHDNPDDWHADLSIQSPTDLIDYIRPLA